MNETIVAAVIAAAVSAVVAYVVARRGLAGVVSAPLAEEKVAAALIVLYSPVGGAAGECAAKAIPNRMYAKPGWDIDWVILDLCGATASQDVDLEFKGGKDPLDKKPTPGKKHLKGKLKINDLNKGERFAYDIKLGGSKVGDPDIEIVEI